ncbi:uncharacterized protein LOC119277597 [Triticum dicoccoides]|uniref:uncharacterized protein LOC119277597 n=1 Tax=Triticum dicoccoides TaxID=85692 RepID=UPI00188DDEE9|nr:uncharacterized protein LOC119277597 [Triticum dicoccoides]
MSSTAETEHSVNMVEPGGLRIIGDDDMTEEEMRVYDEEQRKIDVYEKEKKEMEERPTRRQMQKRSRMWDHFSEVLVGRVLKFGKCKYCNRDIKAVPEINELIEEFGSTNNSNRKQVVASLFASHLGLSHLAHLHPLLKH